MYLKGFFSTLQLPTRSSNFSFYYKQRETVGKLPLLKQLVHFPQTLQTIVKFILNIAWIWELEKETIAHSFIQVAKGITFHTYHRKWYDLNFFVHWPTGPAHQKISLTSNCWREICTGLITAEQSKIPEISLNYMYGVPECIFQWKVTNYTYNVCESLIPHRGAECLSVFIRVPCCSNYCNCTILKF